MSESNEVKEIQDELLVLLKLFHTFCSENEIRYSLHGGTLLGAVREKGFIPWDDDADISVTRSEYEKLLKAFALSDSEMEPDIKRDKMKKIWLRRKGKPIVWLDLFIYDAISEKKLAAKLKLLGIKLLTPYAKNEVSMEQFRANGRATGVAKAIYELIYACGKHISLEKRVAKIDHFCETAFCGSGKYIHRANDQLFAYHIVLPRTCMDEYQMATFEDTELMIAKGYHAILASSYGDDYMTPKRGTSGVDRVHELARANY